MSLPAKTPASALEYLPSTFSLGFQSPEEDDRVPAVPFTCPEHAQILSILFAFANSGVIRLEEGRRIEVECQFNPKRIVVSGLARNDRDAADRNRTERVLRSLGSFAMVGSEDLRNVRLWVDGYPYARIASEYANELRLRNRHPTVLPDIAVDDSPFLPMTFQGAEPMRVSILSKRRVRIRLRGMPYGSPFARAANGEMRRRVVEEVAKALGIVPTELLP